MPLGTLDRTPPPFFRQGPSALTRLTFFSALAVFLMVADTRFELTRPLRACGSRCCPLHANAIPCFMIGEACERCLHMSSAMARLLTQRVACARLP